MLFRLNMFRLAQHLFSLHLFRHKSSCDKTVFYVYNLTISVKIIDKKCRLFFCPSKKDLPKHSIVSMIEAISWTSITPSLSTSNSLKIHSSLFCSVVQVAISRANRNSLKSKNPFPSESKILKICLLNLYPSPKILILYMFLGLSI